MAARFIPDLAESDKNVIKTLWDRLASVPGGRLVFSHLAGRAAPYTGTIDARVEELGLGHSRVTMADRRAVRNHLRCIHAIALANLAELTGNVAVAYTLPDDARFIVAGMELDYVKKARGRITGVCNCPAIVSSEEREYRVEVELLNDASEVVTRAVLRTLVGPKKKHR
jgi:acyl-coenzyme A thioesterase PaaI-like protein